MAQRVTLTGGKCWDWTSRLWCFDTDRVLVNAVSRWRICRVMDCLAH
ncbi:hypothetical protein [Rubritalea tangerina]